VGRERWAAIRKALTPAALVFIAAAGAWAAPSENAEESLERRETQALRRVRYTMGALLKATLKGDDPAVLEAAAEAMFVEAERWDGLLSAAKPDSELSRINTEAPKDVPVSSDTARAVGEALDWAGKTKGAFDPTVGPLVKLWGFDGKAASLPREDDIVNTRDLVGFRRVDATTASVRLWARGMGLDLSAVAKGWALDRALERVNTDGIEEIVLNFGGRVLFWSREPRAWPASILHPEWEGSSLPSFEVSGNGALATAAATDHYFVAADPKDSRVQQKRYGHILDPRTGWPAEPCESVTVWAPTAAAADALSTAIFVMGPEEGLAYANRENVAASIAYHDVLRGSREIYSDAWPKKAPAP